MDASRGWIDTGIDLRGGDIVQIQATGTVTLSTNASDVADPSGPGRTVAHRLRRCRLSPPAR